MIALIGEWGNGKMENGNFQKENMSCYDSSVLEKVFEALSVSYPEQTREWFGGIKKIFQCIIQKWLLVPVCFLPDSSLGILFRAYSEKFTANVVVKIIPPYIMRYESELAAYQNLSNKYMCSLIDYDNDSHSLLLEDIKPGTPFDFYRDKENLKAFFDIVYETTGTLSNDSAIMYFELYSEKIQMAEKNIYSMEERKSYIEQSSKLIRHYFANDKLYYMHGDLHSGNVLKYGDFFRAIDPLGFLAPKDFIFVRFAVFQLLYEKNKEQKLRKIIEFLSGYYTEKEKFMAALLIDTDMCIHTGLVQLSVNRKMAAAFIDLTKFLQSETQIPF